MCVFRLAENRNEKGKDQRMAIVETLQELMTQDDRIVVLEGDLGAASGFAKIGKSHPERFIQCGIAEANMTGVAAGLSLLGFKPWIHSFAPFVSRRNFDQLYVSGAYAQNTINIYGSDPGFAVAHNGGTHTAWEDVALMRTIPGSIVVDPCDAVQFAWVVRELMKLKGIHYVRSNRKAVRKVYSEDSAFTLGKGNLLKKGSDVLIVCAGELISEALDAAEVLEEKGYSVALIDMFTIKPLDKELLLAEVKGKKLMISFENHSVIGGLGSAIEEVIAANSMNIRFYKIGVEERFGQVGSAAFLQKEYHLTAQDMIDKVMSELG